MSGDQGDYWRDVGPHMKQESQIRRAMNRESTAEHLTAAGVAFVSKNNGAHLLVAGDWSLWPGTGRWRHHSLPIEGRGVRDLLRAMQELKDAPK